MVIFVSKEDVLHFLSKKYEHHVGVCYSWENEDVHHLFLTPRKHSYGEETKVLFTSGEPCYNKIAQKMFSHVVKISGTESEPTVNVLSLFDEEWKPCDYEYIPTQKELYSRNKGLIELDILKDKHVTIVGLGSFGSQIAIELAKAGVGYFSLFDFDRVELHNLVRHSSLLKDLGRLKTDVIYDAIMGKNPYAKVKLFPYDITNNNKLLDKQIHDYKFKLCSDEEIKLRY